MTESVFYNVLIQFTSDEERISNLWTEIKSAYTNKNRYYHTLQHLENLHDELAVCQKYIREWNVMMLSMFYHDFVFNVMRKDNEEESARVATERLTEIGLPSDKIELCRKQILATKAHHPDEDTDVNFFTDADLSILGQPWEDFKMYSLQIRKEYSIYPTAIFNGGRRKVLRSFLEMKQIYKTGHFFRKYEERARFNISKSLKEL